MTSSLHLLMDAAADSEVPDGIAERAVATARRRRRTRFLAWGAACTVAGLVAVGFGWQSAADSGRVSSPADVQAIPLQLPRPNDLPPLTEAPMDSASAAYVVDGVVVLVNAVTAAGVRAFATAADVPASLAGGDASAFSSPRQAGGDWSTVTLSPDGTRALLTIAPAPTIEGVSHRVVYLLDIRSGVADRLPGITVPVDGSAGKQLARTVAWAPGSQSFACICHDDRGTRITTIEIADSPSVASSVLQTFNRSEPTEIVWGSVGVVAQLGSRDRWYSIPVDGGPASALAGAGQLAVAPESEEYLVASPQDYRAWTTPDEFPEADKPVVQQAEYRVRELGSDSVETRQFAGSVVGVGSLARGFTVTIDIAGSQHVLIVNADGDGYPLTRLPKGTSSVSFAANLTIPRRIFR